MKTWDRFAINYFLHLFSFASHCLLSNKLSEFVLYVYGFDLLYPTTRSNTIHGHLELFRFCNYTIKLPWPLLHRLPLTIIYQKIEVTGRQNVEKTCLDWTRFCPEFSSELCQFHCLASFLKHSAMSVFRMLWCISAVVLNLRLWSLILAIG